MMDLFNNFSFSEIAICVLGILLLIEWGIKFKNSVGGEFNKKVDQKVKDDHFQDEFKKRTTIQDEIKKSVSTITEAVNTINNRIDRNTEKLEKVCYTVDRLEKDIANLSEADHTIIKAHISDKHKTCMKANNISEFDLEICERMYGCYCQNNSNKQPFMEKLMNDLRKLPIDKE